MYICSSLKKATSFVSDFVYLDDFLDLREAYWQHAWALLRPTWSPSPHCLSAWVPIRLTAGWRQAWFLFYCTPRFLPQLLLEWPTALFAWGSLGFSTQEPLSLKQSWPIGSHRYYLVKWVPQPTKVTELCGGKAHSASCWKWVSIMCLYIISPTDDKGWVGWGLCLSPLFLWISHGALEILSR